MVIKVSYFRPISQPRSDRSRKSPKCELHIELLPLEFWKQLASNWHLTISIHPLPRDWGVGDFTTTSSKSLAYLGSMDSFLGKIIGNPKPELLTPNIGGPVNFRGDCGEYQKISVSKHRKCSTLGNLRRYAAMPFIWTHLFMSGSPMSSVQLGPPALLMHQPHPAGVAKILAGVLIFWAQKPTWAWQGISYRSPVINSEKHLSFWG